MDAVHVLWFNLTIQCIAIMICAKVFSAMGGKVAMGGRNKGHMSMPMLAEGKDGYSHEWHIEPLTQALTELATAKAEIARFETRFVTKEEFGPIKLVVFGMVGVILTTALLSILVLIWRGK